MAVYENNICPNCDHKITSINRKRHSLFWEAATQHFDIYDDTDIGSVISFNDYCPQCRNPFKIEITGLVRVHGQFAFDFVIFYKPKFLDVIFVACKHKARLTEFDITYHGKCPNCGKIGDYELQGL